MPIVFPENIISPRDRNAFLHRLQEILKRRYNAVGLKYNNGEITENEWKLFQQQWFRKSTVLNKTITTYRNILEQDETMVVSIDAIIEE